MTTGTPILVVEDDQAVRDAIGRALRFEGYDVATASDGMAALDAIVARPPAAIVLDVMMPRLDGLELCRRLRAMGDATPILMLTARHEVSDRVAGLDAGADDYLPKPFDLDELFARMRALVRRANEFAEADGPPPSDDLVLDDLRIDPAGRRATRGGRDLELSKTEFDLLELLMENAGIVLSRSVIYERIWGYDFETTSNSLDVYIGYLRRKTEAGDRPRLIHTVRGVGYVIRDD